MTGIAHALDMALLAPFRNYEAIFPETLVQRLKSFTMLADIGDQALRRILAESDWFGIPGGTQLLSKRPELFLPDQWPSYFSKAMQRPSLRASLTLCRDRNPAGCGSPPIPPTL